MRLLDPTRSDQLSSLTDVLDALAVAADPAEFLPSLLLARSADRACLHLTTEGEHLPDFRIRRLITGDGPQLVEPDRSRAAIVEQIARVPIPRIVLDVDLSRETGLPRMLRHHRSIIAIPLPIGSSLLEWVFVFDPRPEGFTVAELEEFIVRARLVSMTVDNLCVAQRLCTSNLRAKHDVDEIAEIQRTLLPEDLPDIPGLRIAASYDAVAHAGGDFYDLIPLGQRPGHPECEGDQRWAILIGDVSGHGPAAAVVMAMLHSIVHAYPNSPSNPAQVLAYANRHLCAKRMRGAFATALLAFYHPATRLLTYCRAGHPPLVLTTWQPQISHQHPDDIGDLPLGIDPSITFTCGEIRLEPGQTVLLYTDGVTEAQNDNGRLLDLQGLELGIAPGEGDARRMVASILNTLEWHSRGTPPADDRTLLALQVV